MAPASGSLQDQMYLPGTVPQVLRMVVGEIVRFLSAVYWDACVNQIGGTKMCTSSTRAAPRQRWRCRGPGAFSRGFPWLETMALLVALGNRIIPDIPLGFLGGAKWSSQPCTVPTSFEHSVESESI